MNWFPGRGSELTLNEAVRPENGTLYPERLVLQEQDASMTCLLSYQCLLFHAFCSYRLCGSLLDAGGPQVPKMGTSLGGGRRSL